MTSVRAPSHAPAHRRRPAAAPLRVVPAGYVPAATRRRRARLAAVACVMLVVGGLFGIAAFQVVLAQGQVRLERLEGEATGAQGEYERLRLEVAELESPGRVVAAAQERLGMVPPPGVTYLSPKGAVSTAPDRPDDPPGEWAAVKPHLAARP